VHERQLVKNLVSTTYHSFFIYNCFERSCCLHVLPLFGLACGQLGKIGSNIVFSICCLKNPYFSNRGDPPQYKRSKMTSSLKNAFIRLLNEHIFCDFLEDNDFIVEKNDGEIRIESKVGKYFRMWSNDNCDDMGTCRVDTLEKIKATEYVVIEKRGHAEWVRLSESGRKFALSLSSQ
jgi:hypothetical protein